MKDILIYATCSLVLVSFLIFVVRQIVLFIRFKIALNTKYKFKVRKVIDLSENKIYPNCQKCNRELSPYAVSKEEFKPNSMILKAFEFRNLIIDENSTEYIVLICRHCAKITDEVATK